MGDKMTIPTRFVRACQFCGYDLDIRADGVHQRTTGWVKNRVGGGGHGVSLPQREDKWAHGYCVDSATHGTLGQGKMF
jgi:hypothetical protein